ncbi:O-methyltransferase [Thiococcus pfennigii]|uniref:O-methyltransferase n=1 Tax=Thiococcus pfennigii TaxID=1057 RepID=UPI001905A493|nr:class I SAM-dependent methyltransferase [Thiococcus pfennigii]MBK1701937.1 SAM-dependent methyltransferase [Thiococcus pfennigii]MBK1730861.1 SAM-dependent methyltransferase [Thiococcus pfennigii]
MSNRTTPVDDRLHDYLVAHSVRESDVQRRLREATAALERRHMQIAPEQGQFMALLVELTGARRIIEIGTFTGYSALCMAEAMPSDGRLICCDVSDEWTRIARRFWRESGVVGRIDLRLAPALETLDALLAEGEGGRFDMAFIDADKGNYACYFERCLALVRPGGLILIDNTLWHGAVADPQAQDGDTQTIRALNDSLLRDERVTISLVPIGDGLTLARKR